MITITTYVAIVVGFIIFCSLAGMLRVRANRRARVRFNPVGVPPVPTYPYPPIQPPGSFGHHPQPWTPPPPSFPSPSLPGPFYPPPGPYPPGPHPTTPSSPNFPLGPSPQPIPPPQPIPQPTQPQPPPLIEEKGIPLDRTSLMDRMREVQTLMMEIHRLQGDPGPNSRARIQELQLRVTALSDTQNTNVATAGEISGPPPAYVQDVPEQQDGRD